jgi:hypothetical protein
MPLRQFGHLLSKFESLNSIAAGINFRYWAARLIAKGQADSPFSTINVG